MKTGFRSEPLILALAFLVLLALPSSAAMAARQPLLIDGTSSLYQRVLTRPGAVIVSEPAAGSEIERPQAFSVFYIFSKKDVDGEEWLEIGPSKDKDPFGWIAHSKTVEWRQSLTMAFTNPSGRSPVLFFDDRGALIDFIEDESLATRADVAVGKIRAGQSSGEAIVSIEPVEYIDFNSQFYLLPILSANEAFLEVGRQKIIEIASIPLSLEEDEPETPREPLDKFGVGVVFVIDTTRSMGPYIDRTRETIKRIFTSIQESDYGNLVSFGMVGFRDNMEGAEGIEYVSRVFSPLR
ncbi:MAG: serine/threonine protein kinase, partial [Kiloniellales bacterium]|nr:serine/threonine protein kinase [Kiloniellales bacterium]